MSAQSLIDQLLKTGMAAVNDARGSVQNARDSGDLHKYAKGAAVGGVLAMLLGTRSGRRMGGSALKIGSMAALGMLAWKTYNDWQAQKAASTGAPAPQPRASAPLALPAPQAEAHDRVMLKAMIAAAKSDGHLDERERELVEVELKRSESDATLRAWFETELRRPVEPADVAAGANTPELAAEVYLASVLVVDETGTMERAYLDALARELRLEDGLKRQLEARAQAA
ncbi:MAG: tellurite resistance TerB family protein [Rubrivivax sp.]|nr:tellurite resistance TerB family protein [Rubrivivax sp.]MDP3610414.1 tellurite resistance TerB family protein [Rubrivivax sp.]